jgi:hypothetical protein
MNVMNIFTLCLEIGFPFLVWTRLRPVWVFGAILLHLGIALNMGLIMFSLFMFTLLLVWMPPSAIRRVFARPPNRLPKLEVRFTGKDPRQRRAAAAVYAADVWQQAQLTEHGHLDKVMVVADSQVAVGAEAVPVLLRSLGMTQPLISLPLGWLTWLTLRFPGVSHLLASLFGGRGETSGVPSTGGGEMRHQSVAQR